MNDPSQNIAKQRFRGAEKWVSHFWASLSPLRSQACLSHGGIDCHGGRGRGPDAGPEVTHELGDRQGDCNPGEAGESPTLGSNPDLEVRDICCRFPLTCRYLVRSLSSLVANGAVEKCPFQQLPNHARRLISR